MRYSAMQILIFVFLAWIADSFQHPSANIGDMKEKWVDLSGNSVLAGMHETGNETNLDPFSYCTDSDPLCAQWAKDGECIHNPDYMFFRCKASCGTCGCLDFHFLCRVWLIGGECVRNQEIMKKYCGKSCKTC